MSLTLAAFALAGCDSRETEMAINAQGNQGAASDVELPGGGAARQLEAGSIQIASKDPYGPYLADGTGRALYVLEGTRQQGQQQGGGQQAQGQQAQPQLGEGQRGQCTGECLAEWPAFMTSGSPSAAQGVDSSMISTISVEGGQQVTYAGWPLYHYRGDRGQGSTAGQDLHDRWGGWYLLSPDGEQIEGRAIGPTSQ
jgi:predicted lipoprotein with Yx(FWY)xxD motif